MEYYIINIFIIVLNIKDEIIRLIKFILFVILIYYLYNIKDVNYNNKLINDDDHFNNSNLNKNKFFVFDYLKNIELQSIYFNATNIKYYYSLLYNTIKVEYNIGFYDQNNNIILPSDLSLYKNIHILCHIKIMSTKANIDSLSNIEENKYFKCVEFFNKDEKIKIGVKVTHLSKFREKEDFFIIYFAEGYRHNSKILSYKYNNDNILNPLFIQNQFTSTLKKSNNKNIKENYKLKKIYYRYPICNLKRNIAAKDNEWIYKNIYNHYFCFCKGEKCPILEMSQLCKYIFYLNIIDNNRYIYNKTEYIFIDFIFDDLSNDDTYPIFQEMEKQKLPVHYITEKTDIYNKYCFKVNKCETIIRFNNYNFVLFGEVLENYLTLILKTKAVVSGKYQTIYYINYFSKLFYNLDYITYIAVGHGVCYFKEFLFNANNLYSPTQNNKILIPLSYKFISIALKYGWKQEDIIKLNLPRWDKYNNYNESINNNSIFVMFTWRNRNKNKKVSKDYVKNIYYFLVNKFLINQLEKNNITLYFVYHYLLSFVLPSKAIMSKNKYVKFIGQKDISDIISKANLFISDFSSIIFDFIYRRKPFIMYIPDSNDPDLENTYIQEYYDLIKSIKNDTLKFENKYFDYLEVINKIIFYINNNFTLEPKLEKFYDSFDLKKGNTTNSFIEYLKNLN